MPCRNTMRPKGVREFVGSVARGKKLSYTARFPLQSVTFICRGASPCNVRGISDVREVLRGTGSGPLLGGRLGTCHTFRRRGRGSVCGEIVATVGAGRKILVFGSANEKVRYTRGCLRRVNSGFFSPICESTSGLRVCCFDASGVGLVGRTSGYSGVFRRNLGGVCLPRGTRFLSSGVVTGCAPTMRYDVTPSLRYCGRLTRGLGLNGDRGGCGVNMLSQVYGAKRVKGLRGSDQFGRRGDFISLSRQVELSCIKGRSNALLGGTLRQAVGSATGEVLRASCTMQNCRPPGRRGGGDEDVAVWLFWVSVMYGDGEFRAL